jgi:hypothetical protein
MNYTSLIFPGIWLASSAAKMDEAIGLFVHVAGIAEAVNA